MVAEAADNSPHSAGRYLFVGGLAVAATILVCVIAALLGRVAPERQQRPTSPPTMSGEVARFPEPFNLDARADYYIERGIDSCRTGNLDQAVADLTQAIKIDPKSAKAYYSRGVVRVKQGEFDLAIQDFETALALDPDYSVAATGMELAVRKKREKEGDTYTPPVQGRTQDQAEASVQSWVRANTQLLYDDKGNGTAVNKRAQQIFENDLTAIPYGVEKHQLALRLALAEQPKAPARKTNAQHARRQPEEIAVDLGSGVKLELVLIPAGSLLMGSSDSDSTARSSEKPQHEVRITNPFYPTFRTSGA
jgi:tetratricopeptide (TPR) repeat protein